MIRFPYLSSSFYKLSRLLKALVFVTILTSGAQGLAKDLCPQADSHELSAVRYQMFTAFQMAYDGYQAPCELKCFEKESCVQSCRQDKALLSLAQHMEKELQSRGLASCQTLSEVCVDECKAEDARCQNSCQLQST